MLSELQRFLGQKCVFQDIPTRALQALDPLVEAPTSSITRDVCAQPHAWCLAYLHLHSSWPGAAAVHVLDVLVRQHLLERCRSVIWPFLVITLPAAMSQHQAATCKLMETAFLQPGSNLGSFCAAAVALHITPGGIRDQWPWQLLRASASAALTSAGPSSGASGRVVDAFVTAAHRVVMLTLLHGSDQQAGHAASSGAALAELEGFMGEMAALLGQHQIVLTVDKVQGMLLNVQPLCEMQSPEGAWAASLVAAVKVAFGVAVDEQVQDAAAEDHLMPWIYLQDSSTACSVLSALAEGSVAAGKLVASALFSDDLDIAAVTMATTALMKVASAPQGMLNYCNMSGVGEGSRCSPQPAATAALSEVLPWLAARLHTTEGVERTCKLLLLSEALRAAGAPEAFLGLMVAGAGVLRVSPAVAAVSSDSQQAGRLSTPMHHVLNLLKAELYSRAYEGGVTDLSGHINEVLWPLLLSSTATASCFAASVLATDMLAAFLGSRMGVEVGKRVASKRRGGAGAGAQYGAGAERERTRLAMDETTAVRLLQQDVRLWLLLAVAMTDTGALLSVTRHQCTSLAAVYEGAAYTQAEGSVRQQQELLAGFLEATSQLHEARTQPAPVSTQTSAASDLRQVTLLLTQTLSQDSWSHLFGSGDGQLLLSHLLLQWREELEGGVHRMAPDLHLVRSLRGVVERVRVLLNTCASATCVGGIPALAASLADMEVVLAAAASQLPPGQVNSALSRDALLASMIAIDAAAHKGQGRLQEAAGRLPDAVAVADILSWRAAQLYAPTSLAGLEVWMAYWAKGVVAALSEATSAEQPAVPPHMAVPSHCQMGEDAGPLDAWMAVLLECRSHPLLMSKAAAVLQSECCESGCSDRVEHCLQLTEQVVQLVLQYGEHLTAWPVSDVTRMAAVSGQLFHAAATEYVLQCFALEPSAAMPQADWMVPETDDADLEFIPGTPSDEQGVESPRPGAHQAAGALPIIQLSDTFRAAAMARVTAPVQLTADAVSTSPPDAPPLRTGTSTSTSRFRPLRYTGSRMRVDRDEGGDGLEVSSAGEGGWSCLSDSLVMLSGLKAGLPRGQWRQVQDGIAGQVEEELRGSGVVHDDLASYQPVANIRTAVRQLAISLAVTLDAAFHQHLHHHMHLHPHAASGGEGVFSREEQLAMLMLLIIQADSKQVPSDTGPTNISRDNLQRDRRQVGLAAGLAALTPLLPCLSCTSCTSHQHPQAGSQPEGVRLVDWVVAQTAAAGASTAAVQLDKTAIRIVMWRMCPHTRSSLQEALHTASADSTLPASGRAAAGKLHGELALEDTSLWLSTPSAMNHAPIPLGWMSQATSQLQLDTAAELACGCLREADKQLAAAAFLEASSCSPRFAAAALNCMAASLHLPLSFLQVEALHVAAQAASQSRMSVCLDALSRMGSCLSTEITHCMGRAASQGATYLPSPHRHHPVLRTLSHLASLCEAALKLAEAAPDVAAVSSLVDDIPLAFLMACRLEQHPARELEEAEQVLLRVEVTCLSCQSEMAACSHRAAELLMQRMLPAASAQPQHAVLEVAGLSLQRVLEAWGASMLPEGTGMAAQTLLLLARSYPAAALLSLRGSA